MCHNDVCPENVVFRDGIAVALLDFEFAAPGRPVYDLAHRARLCVPIDDEIDQARLGWRSADCPARFRVVSDAIDRVEAAVRRSGDAGDPNRSRCGTGPVAASATTAGAAGGRTITTSSPLPSADRAPLPFWRQNSGSGPDY